MGRCIDCGAELAPEWKYCPRCGRRIRPEHCPVCGRALRVQWRFCPSCGREALPETVEAPPIPEEETAELTADIPAAEEMPEIPETDSEDAIIPDGTAGDEELVIVGCVPVEDGVFDPPAGDGEETDIAPEPPEETETAAPEETETLPSEETELPEDAESTGDTDGGDLYERLVRERDALREELRTLDEQANRLSRFDDDFLKLSAQERRRISDERRELRARQGRCHSRVMELSGAIRVVAEQEKRKGRELYSREHPEIVCPFCSARMRKGVDTWPLCPACGENVTAPGGEAAFSALLKVRCGSEGIKRVWYSGNRDFSDYWEAYRGYHKRHDYRYSGSRAVLTVEDAATRGERVPAELPEELLPYHVILRIAPDGEEQGGSPRTENVGMLDMADLSEAERLAFLRLLLTAPPEKERRRFKLE